MDFKVRNLKTNAFQYGGSFIMWKSQDLMDAKCLLWRKERLLQKANLLSTSEFILANCLTLCVLRSVTYFDMKVSMVRSKKGYWISWTSSIPSVCVTSDKYVWVIFPNCQVHRVLYTSVYCSISARRKVSCSSPLFLSGMWWVVTVLLVLLLNSFWCFF